MIGRYEIVEELGKGAMGSVFKARDPMMSRIVALKTIHSAALTGDLSREYRARFERESRASGQLAHPGIVPVFDVGEHEGAPFLVMEFVEGRTLDNAIKRGERFSLDRVCEIGQQLAEALGYAHRQGVIHRDIKPANILLTSREVYGGERPRITDFGIAKLAQSELTSTGQLLGTPAYMPPEQFTGAPIDGRADLFSVGVILYTMATGEQPFAGETVTAVSYKVVYTDPIPPSKLNPAIPAGLEGVILTCLAKNPANRFQTGEELAQSLAALRVNPQTTLLQTAAAPAADVNATLAAAPSSISHPSIYSPAGPQKAPVQAKKTSRPQKRAPLAAVALLAIAGAGGWLVYRHHRQSGAAQQQAISTPTPKLPAPVPAPQPPAPAPAPAPAPDAQQTVPPAAVAVVEPKQAPTKPAAAKTKPSKKPAAKTAAPAAAPAPAPAPEPKPVVAAAPQPNPATAPAPKPAEPVAVAFNPHKLDPNTSSKFKIEPYHLPNGLPVTVKMNQAVYLHFVTGDQTSLDTLFVPPGIQTFSITVMNGNQEIASNIVSGEFKAKKRKNLKIELRNLATVPTGSATLLGPGTHIFISLTNPFF